MTRTLCFLIVFCYLNFSLAQGKDSLVTPKKLNSLVIPSSLLATGFALNALKKEKPLKSFKSIPSALDHFHYSTAIFGTLAPILGATPKHELLDRTIYLSAGFFVSSAITLKLKKSMGVLRPDGSDKKSFPSGHATTAFAMAQWLREEYKASNPVLSYSGYLIATASSISRVSYHKHHLADVLTGAGIGMLSTKAIYALFPKGFSKSKNNRISLYPITVNDTYGITAAIVF
jgi:membrane-associated phospholipid phosphatase